MMGPTGHFFTERWAIIDSAHNGHLFLSEDGEPMFNSRVSDMIKRYLNAVGIDKKGACKLFRDAMATHMHDNGADIRYIQMMLGHADLSSTQIYTQVSTKKLKEVHAATHPADRL